MAFDAPKLARNLIAGTKIQDFNRDVRERRAAKFATAIEQEELHELYSLPKLESLLKSDAAPIAYIDIFHTGRLIRLADMQKKSGKSCLDVVVENFRRGATIRVRDLDQCEGHLKHFTSAVQGHFAAESQINLYLTPPDQTGFPPHFDITDVFIVQCLGRKEWKLYHEYSNKIELPVKETNWDPDRFKLTQPPEGITLNPGDVLYLPRGVMHEAYCGDRESMHLTVSIAPLTFADLITKALANLAERDIQFRRRVPWSIDEDRASNELIAQARECMRELADRMDVSAVLGEQRRLLRPASQPGSSRELESAIASLVGHRSS